jgi:hypothetical protein
MRLRQQDANGDYVLGQPFLVDSPQLVAQLIATRLRLWRGEWFADTSDGTDYMGGVLGERYNKNPDSVIRARILSTPGVTAIVQYSSDFDGTSRLFTVTALVQTQFSKTPLGLSIPLAVPVVGV